MLILLPKEEVFYFQKCLEMCISTIVILHTIYSGHGAAIHYLSDSNSHGKHKIVVQICKFSFNRAIQSVVYIDGSGSKIPGHVYLQDSVFVNNTGVPIYISHTNLHIRGSVLFKGNIATSGGGIYTNNSTVIFYDESDVNFINNPVTDNGGAIYQVYSRIIFEANSIVTFKDKSAWFGGIIYTDKSSITFDNNKANSGGAVFCESSSCITFDGNSSVTFRKLVIMEELYFVSLHARSHSNTTNRYGGAVNCVLTSNITFDGNLKCNIL